MNEFIKNWVSKKLKCSRCGETRSVKWMEGGKPYCNRCIMLVNKESKIENKS